MKTSKIIAAAALSMLAAVGAQAETYEGVHAPVSANSGAEVQAQAVIAAHGSNAYDDSASSHVAPVLTASVGRSVIRGQAVAAAHDSSQNLYREAFVNSKVPALYNIARPVPQQAGL